VDRNRIPANDLSTWLFTQRGPIERAMAARLGPAAPRAGAQETEVLRRFRSFAASELRRGGGAQPALDGIRADERRVTALLDAWLEAAAEVAGERGDLLRSALDGPMRRFRTAMRTTGVARTAKGKPRTRRRAVMAAIDRVADCFLAVEADSGRIVDANPAAGALLGVARDALLGVDALSFVPDDSRPAWWTQLDAMTEGSEPRRFRGQLADVSGNPVEVECSVTRFSTRDRTLALILARPL
jgi:PAS domain S-box-containing protein